MKRLFVSLFASIFSLLQVSSCFAAELNALGMLGENRLLVVCLADFEDASMAQLSQRYQNIDWDGYADRDLLLVEANRKTRAARVVNLRHHQTDGWAKTTMVPKDTVFPTKETEITDRAKCVTDHEVILIGKDTGVKARWRDGFSQTEMFDRVDAMPMRRFEMQEKERQN